MSVASSEFATSSNWRANSVDFETLLRGCERQLDLLRSVHERELQAVRVSAFAEGTQGQAAAAAVSKASAVGPTCGPTERPSITAGGLDLEPPSSRTQSAGVGVNSLGVAEQVRPPPTDSPEDVWRDEGEVPMRTNSQASATNSFFVSQGSGHPSNVAAKLSTSMSFSSFSYTLKSTWLAFEGVDNSVLTPTRKKFRSNKTLYDCQPEIETNTRGIRGSMHWFRKLSKFARSCCNFRRHPIILSPDMTARMLWDIIGTLLIGWDVLIIPMQVFEVPESGFLTGMGWIVTFFWTLDIFASFTVGFYRKGVLVMDCKSIAKRYMTSWFPIDVVVVTGDWIATLGSPGEDMNFAGFGRIARIVRTVRVLRLLRLFKLKRILQELQEHIYTEYAFIITTIVKLLLFILVTNHMVACLWYFVGLQADNGGWVEWHVGSDASWGYKYTTAFHWSLTQFCPASMEVNPKTLEERLVAILVLLIGMIAFSSFVSNITTAMTSLRNLATEDSKQLWLLRRFLQQQSIPKTLGSRICSYLEYTCTEKKNLVQQRDIRLLTLLSEPLQDEMQYQLKVRILERHPLFEHLCNEMEFLMHRLCRVCLTAHSLAAKDVLFYLGDEAKRMYFFVSGELEYEYSANEQTHMQVSPNHGDWICEAALWVTWRHVGELRAGPHDHSASELLSVGAPEFCQVVGSNPNAWVVASAYAERFLQELNNADPVQVADTFMTVSKLIYHSSSGAENEEDSSPIPNKALGDDGGGGEPCAERAPSKGIIGSFLAGSGS